MTKFIPERPNIIRHVLTGWSIFIGIAFIVLLFLLFVLKLKFKDTSLYILGILFLIQVFRDLLATRLYEISFDQDNNQINFFYKTWFINKKRKTLSFDNANIVLTTEKTGIVGLKKSMTINFLNKKTMLLKLNTDKDGFSNVTLEEIYKTAEQLQIPISKV